MKDPYLNSIPANASDYPRGLYDCFPAFPLNENLISTGYINLVKHIKKENHAGKRVFIIDGYIGVDWGHFQKSIAASLKSTELKVTWIDFQDCLKSEPDILQHIEGFLGGEDPLWGTHFPFGLEGFFNAKKVANARILAATAKEYESNNLLIIYGVGSSLIEIWDTLWYIDIPKDIIQEKARNGRCSNIGNPVDMSFGYFYKRSYFVDWPALNRTKRKLLPDIGLLVDIQNENNPASMRGDDFRNALHILSEAPFRVRPWFYPGPWGGKFMQGHMGLDPDQPNFAWSFELIAPENGIVLESSEKYLEFTFDFLMFQENERVLGKKTAKRFQYEWPIRLDYLDTIDGGNLSTQCHPRPDFIRKNFGETFTQDETYYISVAKEGARVYLGLKESSDPHEFKQALIDSHQNGNEVDIDKYVHSIEVDPHDLILIPNGTVHCSGKGNLVLEISATPYIFTFKIYDYLRRDLNGNLRHLNIERAFENIRLEHTEHFINNNYISKPKLISEGNGWKDYELYNRPETFYNIHRIEFDKGFSLNLKNRAFAMNLVEGREIKIETGSGHVARLALYETIIIPEAAKTIKVKNLSDVHSKIVYTYVRPSSLTTKLNDPIK